MAGREPATEQAFGTDDTRRSATWAEACERLGAAGRYWLATMRPDGRPHVMPVLAVWLDGALHFAAGETSRKARNLARDPRCVIAAGDPALDLVVEGEAARVDDEARLRGVADAYASKYGWRVTVRDSAFYGEGAPTAGPPPYGVYAIAPSVAFGFGTDETFGATRWRF